MNDLQIFNNPDFGTLRGIEIDGEAWFVGNDVARALGYSRPQDAIVRHVDEEDSVFHGVSTQSSGIQQTRLINETGVLSLILSSEIPGARKFRRWVVKEVLPSILKTGSFSLPALTTNEMVLQLATNAVELERKVNALEQSQTAIEQKFDTAIEIFSRPTLGTWKDGMELELKALVSASNTNMAILRGKMYADLEAAAGVDIGSRAKRLKSRMKKQGATYRERQAVTKLEVISRDKQLRPIFEGILKKYQAVYMTTDNPQPYAIGEQEVF